MRRALHAQAAAAARIHALEEEIERLKHSLATRRQLLTGPGIFDSAPPSRSPSVGDVSAAAVAGLDLSEPSPDRVGTASSVNDATGTDRNDPSETDRPLVDKVEPPTEMQTIFRSDSSHFHSERPHRLNSVVETSNSDTTARVGVRSTSSSTPMGFGASATDVTTASMADAPMAVDPYADDELEQLLRDDAVNSTGGIGGPASAVFDRAVNLETGSSMEVFTELDGASIDVDTGGGAATPDGSAEVVVLDTELDSASGAAGAPPS